MQKKGQTGNIAVLLPGAIVMIVFVVAIGFGIELLEDTETTLGTDSCAARSDGFINYNLTSKQCYNSSGSHVAVGDSSFNATGDGITGIAKFTTKSKLIVSAIIFLIVLGLLLAMASFKMN